MGGFIQGQEHDFASLTKTTRMASTRPREVYRGAWVLIGRGSHRPPLVPESHAWSAIANQEAGQASPSQQRDSAICVELSSEPLRLSTPPWGSSAVYTRPDTRKAMWEGLVPMDPVPCRRNGLHGLCFSTRDAVQTQSSRRVPTIITDAYS